MVTDAPTTGHDPVVTLNLPREARSARSARRFVSSALAEWGLGALDDPACVVVSELVGNAVQHARYSRILVRVERMAAGGVQVSVVDRSPVTPQRQTFGDGAEHGRGLAIVEALCGGRWGTERLPWGKRVWAVLGAGGPP